MGKRFIVQIIKQEDQTVVENIYCEEEPTLKDIEYILSRHEECSVRVIEEYFKLPFA